LGIHIFPQRFNLGSGEPMVFQQGEQGAAPDAAD
jgi:hypothetical protein